MSTENHDEPVRLPAIITSSWTREILENGRKRFKFHAIQVPLDHSPAPVIQVAVEHPRLAAPPVVVGELVLEIVNLDVARILIAAVQQVLAAQPPELHRVPGWSKP